MSAKIDLENRASFLVVIEAATMGLILLVSTAGNIISCVIMHKGPRLRTWHNLLLLNVVIVDLLACILVAPFAFVVLITGKWMMGETVCSLVAYISTVFLTVSISTLATISISRYFLITDLSHYMRVFKKRNVVWMVTAIWFFALLCAFPPFIGWGEFSFLPGNALCFVYFGSSLSYAAVFTLLVIGLPVFTILACFAKVRGAVKAIKRAKGTISHASIAASEEIDSAKSSFVVVIMVLLCWFPMLLVLILVASGIKMPRQAALMATYVVFLPFALKPVIYFCMKKQFRAGFFALAGGIVPSHKRKRRNRVSHNLAADKTRTYGSHPDANNDSTINRNSLNLDRL